MVCCIIAAYIYAQISAVFRRWCIYWGLIRRGPFDSELPTLLGNLLGKGPRPTVSTVCLTLGLLGVMAIWAGGGLESPALQATSDNSIPRLSQLIGLG